MKRTALWVTLGLVVNPLSASAAIGLYTDPGVIWRGDFEGAPPTSPPRSFRWAWRSSPGSVGAAEGL